MSVHSDPCLRCQVAQTLWLEETGLSRMELLYDNMEGKGCQLKDDPFFQLVKGSRTVREMIVPPGAEFTADQVIE